MIDEHINQMLLSDVATRFRMIVDQRCLAMMGMVIVMQCELGRIMECVRSGCHSFRTVSECLWLILRKSMVLLSV